MCVCVTVELGWKIEGERECEFLSCIGARKRIGRGRRTKKGGNESKAETRHGKIIIIIIGGNPGNPPTLEPPYVSLFTSLLTGS